MTIRTIGPSSPRRIRTIQTRRIERGRDEPKRQLAPVYVCWTSGVTDQEGKEMVGAVHEVLALAGQNRKVQIFGSRVWAPGDFGSADWYQKQAMFTPSRERVYGSQTNTTKILSLMRDEEPWQQKEPHLDVMFVDHDASTGDPNNNFVFGVTWPGFGFVQSLRRSRSVNDQDLQLRLIRRVARHEFAHVLYVPSRSHHTVELLGRHCTNVCCMRQGLSIEDWIQHLRQEETAGTQFCDDCTQELRSH